MLSTWLALQPLIWLLPLRGEATVVLELEAKLDMGHIGLKNCEICVVQMGVVVFLFFAHFPRGTVLTSPLSRVSGAWC